MHIICKFLFVIILVAFNFFNATAQLPAGSVAPDFTVTDINGNTHHLYGYLNQGYTVVLQMDATWVGPSWTYSNSGALSELYYSHGVDYGGNVIVLFLEADATTTTADIYGTGPNTQGNWTNVIPFPIINLAPIGGGYETQVGNDYSLAYYPTIYTICPNGTVTETGQITAAEHWSFIQNSQCQTVYDVDAYIHTYIGESATCGSVDLSFTLTNLGFNPLVSGQFTVTGVSPAISYNWNGYLNRLESTQISFGLVNVVGPVEIVFANSGEENFSNNSYSPGILNTQFETSNVIQVELATDCWPEETTWNITDSQGNVVYSSGIYGDGNFNTQDPEYYLVNVVLPDLGCYSFNFYDSYGDGMSGSNWGCFTDGMVSLNGLDANYNVTNTFYSVGGSQQFSVLSVPFTVNQIMEVSYNVTLNVDMNLQTVSPNGVHLAGSFQGWNPGDPNYEMFDIDGDGIYTIQFYLPPGQYEYKFVNDNTWNNINEDIPIECSYNWNRFLEVTSGIINETYCFSKCTESCDGTPTGSCEEIFISEYVEGTANNKAIELYNPTNSPINLGAMGYQIGRFTNGSVTPTYMDVTGIIQPHDVRVFVLDKRNPNGIGQEVPVVDELQALADTFVNPIYTVSFSPFYFNGDDAVVLLKDNGTVLVDLIGRIGEDPGTGWYDFNDPAMTPITNDRTLVRKSNIGQGVSVNPDFFNPLDEWEVYPVDDFSHLGSHESWCSGGEIIGCTDLNACNYDPQATIESGTCYYVGQTCDDGNAQTFNDVYSANCNCSGVQYAPNGCDPSSIDWSNETSIFLPDTLAGENLMEGFVNNYYSDNIYINTPIVLDNLIPGLPVSGLPLETADLTNVQVIINGQLYSLETLGMAYQVNNGFAVGSNSFNPGVPSCIEFYGTPNQTGIYPLVLTFYITTSLFGVPQASSFELYNYEIVISVNPFGCTNPLACNYTATATIDDGSCIIVGSTCDDNNANTFGDEINANCECSGSAFSYGSLNPGYYFICGDNSAGINLNFNQSPVGISQYGLQWYYRDGIQSAPTGGSTLGWTLIPGATSPSYTTETFSGSRTFACYVMPFAGVGLPAQWANEAIYFEVANFSAQSIIGNPNITPFTNYVYVVNPIAGNTYNWSTTNGGIISGQGTNTVTVMWGQNGPYQITLTEGNGVCSDESTLFVVNNSCSISVAAVSADGSTFCPGTTASIQAVTAASGVTYQWYLNGAALSGETNIDLEITSGGNYQVMITQGACTAISQILVITELPAVVIPNLILNQSNPGCSGGSATITAEGGSFTSYLWSNGGTSSSIEVTTSGDYTVELSDDNGCVATAGPVSVNFALQGAVPICLVTVDSTTGSNVIVWEPVASEVTSSYVIYKETNVADVYAAIGTVDYGSDGIFEDVNSNSAVQASRYKLALIDTCDIESSLSDLHKTIHLTSNLGVGNTVNLIWSHYEGFAFGSYNIYRGTASDNMTLLATIASNLNSYTDLFPLTNGYYMIEVEGVSCDPSRTIQTSKSNIINYEIVGVEDLMASQISIYPNPATNNITLNVSAELVGGNYKIYDALGREVMNGKLSSTSTIIDVDSLARGSYRIAFVNAKAAVSKALILE